MPTTTDLQMLADILSEQGFKVEFVPPIVQTIGGSTKARINVGSNTGYQIARVYEDFYVHPAQTNGHKMQDYKDVVETVYNYNEYLKIA